MDWLHALILGIVQGLTEYLPVSSSGHLEIGKALLGPEAEAGGLTFDIVVHVATVLSTLVILWKEVIWIFGGLFSPFKNGKMNNEQRYVVNILISMIPVGIVGLFMKDSIESLYADDTIKLKVVGVCLLITASLLALTHFYKPKEKETISPWHAFIIGIAQACAVLPGLSRSGTTIATGLLCGVKKESVAQFSFLMVLIPIMGEAFLDVLKFAKGEMVSDLGVVPALVGFFAAFLTGCFACRFMIEIVRRQRLIWFALYCAIVGSVAIFAEVF